MKAPIPLLILLYAFVVHCQKDVVKRGPASEGTAIMISGNVYHDDFLKAKLLNDNVSYDILYDHIFYVKILNDNVSFDHVSYDHLLYAKVSYADFSYSKIS